MTNQAKNDIRSTMEFLADKVGIPKSWLPPFDSSNEEGFHISVDNDDKFHFVFVERGQERKRQTTDNLDQLLYWIFESLTFHLAAKFELEHRIQGQDFRRILFRKQEELLATLNREWKLKNQARHDEILRENPFVDKIRRSYSDRS